MSFSHPYLFITTLSRPNIHIRQGPSTCLPHAGKHFARQRTTTRPASTPVLMTSASASASGSASASQPSSNVLRVLALGGSGRVGQETLHALSLMYDGPLHVSVASRDEGRAKAVAGSLTGRSGSARRTSVTYAPLTLDLTAGDVDYLATVMQPFDVVLHTAGPFQGRRGANATAVARAAIQSDTFYVDVCDDSDCAFDVAALSATAARAGVIGITSAGIYPGVSNLLVCDAITQLDRDSPLDTYTDTDTDSDIGNDRQTNINIDSIRLSYFTAGSGGIGATILASTYLLLGEDVELYDRGGAERLVKATSESAVVDFGGGIGKRTVFALRLPEVRSLHQFVAPNAAITARFSTAPPVWNVLLPAMARFTPVHWLRNRSAMQALARVSLPIVRAVDKLSGARTGIIAEVVDTNGQGARVIFEHETLATCVGEGTAAFVKLLLLHRARRHNPAAPSPPQAPGSVNPGIWFPEQLDWHTHQPLIADGTRTCDRLKRELFKQEMKQ